MLPDSMALLDFLSKIRCQCLYYFFYIFLTVARKSISGHNLSEPFASFGFNKFTTLLSASFFSLLMFKGKEIHQIETITYRSKPAYKSIQIHQSLAQEAYSLTRERTRSRQAFWNTALLSNHIGHSGSPNTDEVNLSLMKPISERKCTADQGDQARNFRLEPHLRRR